MPDATLLIPIGENLQNLGYIGPGAGFAAAGSVLVLLGTFLLAFGIILIWPLKAAFRLVGGKSKAKAKVKRMVVVGLDGFDPDLQSVLLQKEGCPIFNNLKKRLLSSAEHFAAFDFTRSVVHFCYRRGCIASQHI